MGKKSKSAEPEPSPEQKLRPSTEVYHRIRWDARYDPSRFVIGYEDRIKGLQEIAFAQFVPGGDIPWYRIYYFRCGDEILWDRRTRFDRIFGSGDPSADSEEPAAPGAVKPPKQSKTNPSARPSQSPTPKADANKNAKVVEEDVFAPLPAFRFDASAGVWRATSFDERQRITPPQELRVVTYNVLGDERKPELHVGARAPALLEVIRSCEADLIGLQEVTAEFLARLLDEPWVREHFWISDGPSGATLKPYGQLLLSRWPLRRVSCYAFSTSKRAISAEVELGDAVLNVVVVHLTSNRAEEARAKRVQQMELVLRHLDALATRPRPSASLILGDFNDAPSMQDAPGFVDAWAFTRPDDSGFTFDPVQNPLAALGSVSGRAERFDRVLARPVHALKPTSSRRIGDVPSATPPPGTPSEFTFPSDHFGVACTLAWRGSAPSWPASVHQSALVMIPPESTWAPIQALRTQHDKHVERWMPHVTLLYGFVPESHFEAAAQATAEAVASLKPFEVELSHFDAFEHRASSTVWIRPDTKVPGALIELQRALLSAFPTCQEQQREGGFTPHLTVAQCTNLSSARESIGRWQAAWKPSSFVVDEVCLISRRGDEPFEVRHRIKLGGNAGAGSAGANTPSAEARPDVLASLLEWFEPLCEEAAWGEGGAPAGPVMHLLGSHRLGVADEDSDLDLVCVGPHEQTREEFFARVKSALLARDSSFRVRSAADAIVPVLKLHLDGRDVDLAYARLPAHAVPAALEEMPSEVLSKLDSESQRALWGCLEADALLRAATEHTSAESFRTLLREVRRWADARQLRSNAFGYLGSYSWAVLVAWACAHAPRNARQSELRTFFFATFAGWDWHRPVALTAAAARYTPHGPRDRMPVMSLVEPCVNSARNVTASTLSVMQRELARARDLSRLSSGEAIDQPIDIGRANQNFILVSAEAASDDVLDAVVGWLESQVIALVLDLERVASGVRPFPHLRRDAKEAGVRAAFVIGLDGVQPDRVRAVVDEFVKRFDASPAHASGATLRASLVDASRLT
jgi:poly(A) polymerase